MRTNPGSVPDGTGGNKRIWWWCYTPEPVTSVPCLTTSFQAGRQLSFNLGEIFPNLSYRIVASLERGDLNALYEAQERHASGVLGDNATKEFVLRHVFQIAPELVETPSDLLRVLLRRHYRKQRIPFLLEEHFVQVVCRQEGFKEWPLEAIIPDREAFFSFLQERWPIFS